MPSILTSDTNASWGSPPAPAPATQGLDLTTKLIVTVAYGVLFPIALLGNVFVIRIVFRKASMQTVTNFLIINMTVANLLVTCFTMPYSVMYVYITNHWFGGAPGTICCKLVHFGYALSISASILALLALSVDRYFAVLRPFRRLRIIRKPKIATSLIWLLSLVIMSPYLVQFRVTKALDGSYHCIVNWAPFDTLEVMRIYFVNIFVVLYSLPLVTMAALYFIIARTLWKRKIPGIETRSNRRAAEISKRKVVKMLITVVTVFAVCWIPAHVMHFVLFFSSRAVIPHIVQLMSYWVCHVNSGVNPWLYIILNENFRKGFQALIVGIKRTSTKRWENSKSYFSRGSRNDATNAQASRTVLMRNLSKSSSSSPSQQPPRKQVAEDIS